MNRTPTAVSAGRAVMTPGTAWSPPLIDLAHRELSQHSMPQSEGMTDSPHGPVHHRDTGTGACTRPPAPEHKEPRHSHFSALNSVRRPASASRTYGRCAVGPFGPILDPDASPRRAHKQAKNHKIKIGPTE